MEVKIIVIIISLIILAGIVLSTINKKKIMGLVSDDKKNNCSNEIITSIKGFDKGGNQAVVSQDIQEEMENLKRTENREEVHPDPNATKRSDICTTDSCQSIDPYNKQLRIICKHECNN